MGRIRTKYIKATTKKLMDENQGRFTKDYKGNKDVLKEIVDTPSKQLRNKIAGSIARTIKNVKE